jgi:multidrug resistance efflux pump
MKNERIDAMTETRRKNPGSIWSKLLLATFATLLAACSAIGVGQPATPTPVATPEVESALVRAEGRVVPQHFANLSTAASGQVTEILAQEGQQVEAGAVLLRLGDREQYQADLAAAELDLLNAKQSLEDLHMNAGVELALSKKALAETNKELVDAEDEYENLSKPIPQADLERANASVILAEKRVQKAEEDLALNEQRYKNKSHILWMFLTNKEFKDLLENLRRGRDLAKKRYEDALERYNDLKNHPDEIELAQAQANLGLVQARIAEIEGDIAKLENGPDPDKLAAAEARIKAAETALTAAQSVLKNSEILAPFPGTVAELNTHVGEWIEANQPVMVLADFSQWEIETDDLTELDVPEVRLGQTAAIRPDAMPELELDGVVSAIKDLSEEKRGDITYTVTIRLIQADPRLRWGMTVAVDFRE